MYWESNACYRISYKDQASITFQVISELPHAMHKIKVRDLSTGCELNLLDLLATSWIDFRRIVCPPPHAPHLITINEQPALGRLS